MNLIVEQGNTTLKVAVFDNESMLTSVVYKEFDEVGFSALLEQYPIKKGIYSFVTEKNDQLAGFLKNRLSCFLIFDETVNLPVKVQYQTPKTLGRDRLAAVVGANYLNSQQNLLVIDAGTAITYDVVEAGGVFIGGNISPGMSTRFRSLNTFTQKLPLVREEEEVPYLGTSTQTAILSGVVTGIVYEMDGYINDLREIYLDLFVFLTGGHSFYFERRLKNSIFVSMNLVLVGLNRILEYNVEI